MGLFFYNQKGSIISIEDLPTTEIIEPKNLFLQRREEIFLFKRQRLIEKKEINSNLTELSK